MAGDGFKVQQKRQVFIPKGQAGGRFRKKSGNNFQNVAINMVTKLGRLTF
jgi:hypothetical protein